MKDHEQTDFDKARDAEEEKYGKAELGTSMRSSFKAGANWARDWYEQRRIQRCVQCGDELIPMKECEQLDKQTHAIEKLVEALEFINKNGLASNEAWQIVDDAIKEYRGD
jgi:hypothetical protein